MKKNLLLLAGLMCSMTFVQAADLPKELSEYKLDNGLTVLLWEDHDAPDVTGYVVVRAGAVDEPSEYTGLAHYLEHMLFKGTQRIGALNWEAEKPIYDSIIALYDQYSDATDPKVRALHRSTNAPCVKQRFLLQKTSSICLISSVQRA